MILTNAKIVLSNEVVDGTLHIEDGRIRAIDQGRSALPDAIDCDGGMLLPGLVELHTDNMEKHFTPRPGVAWPAVSAFKTHDAQMVAAGITTVFDAVSIGDIIDGSERLANLTRMVDALAESRERGLTRADHLLHLRCEVSHAGTLDNFNALIDRTGVQLVSVMDHSPGQRQFADIGKYRQYYQGKYKLSDAELEAFIERQSEASARYADPFRRAICETCAERGIALASHDDATLDHVEESHGYGMTIAEFPTTLEAARAAHERGMAVLMGAPNVVRGGSHSGNIAAHVLAGDGLLDVLSSDYYPTSLLDGAIRIAMLDSNDYDLPRAIALVTRRPADAAGLADRGRIEAGAVADLVWARIDDRREVHVEHVWKDGRRVF